MITRYQRRRAFVQSVMGIYDVLEHIANACSPLAAEQLLRVSHMCTRICRPILCALPSKSFSIQIAAQLLCSCSPNEDIWTRRFWTVDSASGFRMEWCLVIFPQGNNEPDTVSIYLRLLNLVKLRCMVSFTLCSSTGGFTTCSPPLSVVLFQQRRDWGYRSWYSLHLIWQNLSNNIDFTVKIHETQIAEPNEDFRPLRRKKHARKLACSR